MSEPIRKEYSPDKVLRNYKSLVAALPVMNERELYKALQRERDNGEPRKEFVFRLHRRFSTLRQQRELKEYLS